MALKESLEQSYENFQRNLVFAKTPSVKIESKEVNKKINEILSDMD